MSKYIYHLYKDRTNYYHCERYPIIYENKTFIYFKTPPSDCLEHALKNKVREHFYYSMGCYYAGYYLNPISEDDLNQLREKVNNENIISTLRTYYTYLHTAENTVIDYKNKINGYIAALENDGYNVEEIKSMLK